MRKTDRQSSIIEQALEEYYWNLERHISENKTKNNKIKLSQVFASASVYSMRLTETMIGMSLKQASKRGIDTTWFSLHGLSLGLLSWCYAVSRCKADNKSKTQEYRDGWYQQYKALPKILNLVRKTATEIANKRIKNEDITYQ